MQTVLLKTRERSSRAQMLMPILKTRWLMTKRPKVITTVNHNWLGTEMTVQASTIMTLKCERIRCLNTSRTTKFSLCRPCICQVSSSKQGEVRKVTIQTQINCNKMMIIKFILKKLQETEWVKTDQDQRHRATVWASSHRVLLHSTTAI